MDLDTARAHIGSKVVYDPGPGGDPLEEGVIQTVGDRYVHVRYGSDYGTKATDPAALTLLSDTTKGTPP